MPRPTTTLGPSSASAAGGRVRGITRPGDPRVAGAIIGGIGGTVFVAANAPGLPGSWQAPAYLAGALTWAGWCVAVLIRRRRLGAVPRPGRAAGIVYVAGIVGMLAIMFVGSRLLEATHHGDLLPAVIALAVGVHFMPYARAFGAPVFGRLGLALALAGVLGLAVGLAAGGAAASAAAVVAGLVLLGGIAWDAVVDAP